MRRPGGALGGRLAHRGLGQAMATNGTAPAMTSARGRNGRAKPKPNQKIKPAPAQFRAQRQNTQRKESNHEDSYPNCTWKFRFSGTEWNERACVRSPNGGREAVGNSQFVRLSRSRMPPRFALIHLNPPYPHQPKTQSRLSPFVLSAPFCGHSPFSFPVSPLAKLTLITLIHSDSRPRHPTNQTPSPTSPSCAF